MPDPVHRCPLLRPIVSMWTFLATAACHAVMSPTMYRAAKCSKIVAAINFKVVFGENQKRQNDHKKMASQRRTDFGYDVGRNDKVSTRGSGPTCTY